MSTWAEFYNEIRDPTWPGCDNESEFELLPKNIQKECIDIFGYTPGAFKNKSKLVNKKFPIVSTTACQLKWNWSTVFLTTGETASCHRTDHHKFDTAKFDFHNTPRKLDDRNNMLQGQWPTSGCTYCQNIEAAGGQSDRITNLDFPGIHAPPELDQNPIATHVTPRILEVYFNKKLFEWLKVNGHNLSVFNILGGEPLYQEELEQCLELFEQFPAPELKLQIFTNLNARLPHLQKIVQRVKQLIDTECIREFEVTASLDCWGPQQEYVRYPLNLEEWEKNFEYLLSNSWINLIVSSTVTPLTVKTLPELLEKINKWNQIRPVYHYQNSVNSPSYMFIDIFGDIFKKDFDNILELKPSSSPEEISSKNYMQGIATQSQSTAPNIAEIQKLFDFLNKMDVRRSTSWTTTFPWLIDEFKKYNLHI